MCSRYSCHEVSGYFYLLKQSCYAMSWLSDLSLNSVRSEYFILPVQIIMRKEAWNCILSEIPFVTLKLMLEHQTNLPWIVMMLGALPACQTHLLTPVIHQDRHKLIHQQLFIHIYLYTLLYLFTYIFIYCLFNIIHQSNAWKRKYFLNRVFWEVEVFLQQEKFREVDFGHWSITFYFSIHLCDAVLSVHTISVVIVWFCICYGV